MRSVRRRIRGGRRKRRIEEGRRLKEAVENNRGERGYGKKN